METKEIQKLLDFIASSGLDEVNIETSELKVSVKRNSGTTYIAAPQQVAMPVQQQQAPQLAAAIPTAPAAVATPKVEESNHIIVRSPMIGTFYRTQNPEKPPFVEVGDEISKGQPVCIIEAMKLFNEIESEVSGRIVKVLVENATPVEYDQPLFLVEPA